MALTIVYGTISVLSQKRFLCCDLSSLMSTVMVVATQCCLEILVECIKECWRVHIINQNLIMCVCVYAGK